MNRRMQNSVFAQRWSIFFHFDCSSICMYFVYNRLIYLLNDHYHNTFKYQKSNIFSLFQFEDLIVFSFSFFSSIVSSQLCSDANKTATSSSHQDSEYDTASDSQSSDEADPLHKPEPPVSGDTGGGDTGGGDTGGGGGIDDGVKNTADAANTDGLIDVVTAKTNIMQLSDGGSQIDEKRKISHDENDIHDDADGEADDDDEW